MFYLKAPRGDISLEKLLDLAKQRIEYLTILRDYDEETIEEFHQKLESYGHLKESVTENHPNDRVAHFILRLAMVHRRNHRLTSAFVQLESLLFNYRVRTLPERQLQSQLRTARRHLRELQSTNSHSTSSGGEEEIFEVLDNSINGILRDCLLSNPPDDHLEQVLRVPFQCIPNMVRNRSVALDHGQALITRPNVPRCLKEMFSQALAVSLSKSAGTRHGCEEDDRQGPPLPFAPSTH